LARQHPPDAFSLIVVMTITTTTFIMTTITADHRQSVGRLADWP
jgi:hypothetical protein